MKAASSNWFQREVQKHSCYLKVYVSLNHDMIDRFSKSDQLILDDTSQ